MSRQELADAVNAYLWTAYRERCSFDGSYVGKLEQGVHRWPRARHREAFRRVLGAESDAELGFFITRRAAATGSPGDLDAPGGGVMAGEEDGDVDRRQVLTAAALPGLAALVAAVASPLTGAEKPPTIVARTGIDDLATQLSGVRRAYQHSRYSAAARSLASLLRDVRCQWESGTGGARIAVLEAEAYQVASGLLLKGGDPALAAVAAERGVAAARSSGDEVTRAASARAVVHCLLCGGHPNQGVALAVRAAERLAACATMDSPAVLSVYGALLLRGALAAAGQENRDQAYSLLGEAAGAAEHVGGDRNLCWTAFGPTNVAAHRVAVAVELGDAGTAVALAARVDVAKLQLPERKAMLLLDTARALSQWGKWDRAFDAIRRAEGYAPEEVRARPAAHAMVKQLVQRAPASLQRRARAYARDVGVTV